MNTPKSCLQRTWVRWCNKQALQLYNSLTQGVGVGAIEEAHHLARLLGSLLRKWRATTVRPYREVGVSWQSVRKNAIFFF
jgi:hypothetical protein